MADTIVHGLEWGLGRRFEAEAQVRWAEGEAVHARLGKLAGLGDRLNGLDLEPEDTVIVPPLGIRTAIVPALNTAPGSTSPAPVAKLRVVKIRQGLIHCGLVFDLGDLDSRRTQVEQVTDEVRMACMLDAELHRETHPPRKGTEGGEPLFVEGRVLAINRDESIGVSAQNILEPLAVGRDRGREANDNPPLPKEYFRCV